MISTSFKETFDPGRWQEKLREKIFYLWIEECVVEFCSKFYTTIWYFISLWKFDQVKSWYPKTKNEEKAMEIISKIENIFISNTQKPFLIDLENEQTKFFLSKKNKK